MWGPSLWTLISSEPLSNGLRGWGLWKGVTGKVDCSWWSVEPLSWDVENPSARDGEGVPSEGAAPGTVTHQ